MLPNLTRGIVLLLRVILDPVNVLCRPVDVRFIPIATEALRSSEMAQWASGLQKCRERPLLQVPVFACRAASLSISDCTACAAWPANSFCWVAAAA
jgi:hypothetical protein